MRKEAIVQKQQKLQNLSEIQNNQTYANIVKTTIKETTPPTKPVVNLTEKHHLKYVILIILEAHIASIGVGRRDRTLANSKLLCCGSAHRAAAVLQMTTVWPFLGAS